MQIYFRSLEQFSYFKQLVKDRHLIVKETKKAPHYAIHLYQISENELFRYFIDLYITFQLKTEIYKVIREHYFYSNEADIHHIYEWTHWLLQERTFLEQQFQTNSLVDYLMNQCQQRAIFRKYINFEPFILFQLQSFHQDLIQIVGYAIDEIKREEAYQHFIQTLRTFINEQAPQRSLLYIVQRSSFRYFDEQGKQIAMPYLKQRMKRMPLYLFGLDETEIHIAPVISLLPKRIHIYGTEENDGKIVTLLRIFEERAQFSPIDQFPFARIV